MRRFDLQWAILTLLVVLLVVTVARSDPEPQPCVVAEEQSDPWGWCYGLSSREETQACLRMHGQDFESIFDQMDREFAEANE